MLEYLSKKGYSRTEAMLRRESATHDAEGRPITRRPEETGAALYIRAFSEWLHPCFWWCAWTAFANLFIDLLRNWIEETLDIYKAISNSNFLVTGYETNFNSPNSVAFCGLCLCTRT